MNRLGLLAAMTGLLLIAPVANAAGPVPSTTALAVRHARPASLPRPALYAPRASRARLLGLQAAGPAGPLGANGAKTLGAGVSARPSFPTPVGMYQPARGGRFMTGAPRASLPPWANTASVIHRDGGVSPSLPDAPGWTASSARRPTLAPDPQSTVGAISCVSATNCWATANYSLTDAHYRAALFHLKNGHWSSRVAPAPSGVTLGAGLNLSSLSCLPSGRCVAAGEYSAKTKTKAGFKTEPLIESEQHGKWTAMTALLPGNADQDPLAILRSVSCATITSCVATGTYNSKNRVLPLVDEASASGWHAQVQSLPKNAASPAYVTTVQVVCPSAGNCTIAGGYDAPGGARGLILQETRGAWKTIPVSTPNAGLTLQALDCPAAGACVAVGLRFASRETPLAAVENKGTWTAAQLPLPAGAKSPSTYANMSGIACSAIQHCVAVGGFARGQKMERPLAIVESPAGWKAPAVRSPDGKVVTGGVLFGVACSGHCVAVGTYQRGITPRPLVLTGSGLSATSPSPPGANGLAVLQTVTCPDGSLCLAGGNYLDAHQNTQPWFTLGSGAAWMSAAPGLPSGAGRPIDFWLARVSCAAGGSCEALGTDAERSLFAEALSHSGSSPPARIPSPADAGWNTRFFITGLTCPAGGVCTGTAAYINRSGDLKSEIVGLHKGKWTVAPAPLPGGPSAKASVDLSSVSCRSTAYCEVAGAYIDAHGGQHGLLITGSGHSWKSFDAPLPSDAVAKAQPFLDSVSCSTGGCVAAGDYRAGGNHIAPVLVTGGPSGWKAINLPLLRFHGQKPDQAALLDVSCGVAGCAAAGIMVDQASDEAGFEAVHGGSGWFSVPTPVPSGAIGSDLAAVSCRSKPSCVAVGAYLNSQSSEYPLVVSGSGSTWKFQHLSWPGQARPESNLSLIDCASPGSCVAAGGYLGPGYGEEVLTVFQSGSKWKPRRGPLPSDAFQSPAGGHEAAVFGLSCAPPTFCVEAGEYIDHNLIGQGLIDRRS